MKKIIALLIMLFSAHCLASDGDIIFSEANQAYRKGKFEKAYNLYNKIEPKTSQIHYNLGNCAYKLKKYGYALLHWRRAENNWGLFGREELLSNMKLVRKHSYQATDNQQTSPMHRILTYFRDIKKSFISVIRSMHLLTLQLLVLLVWILLFVYLKYLYRKKYKAIILILFFLQVLFGGMLALKYSFSFRRFGVVVAQQADLRSGPGKNYALLGLLPEAKECVIRKISGDFYKIKVDRHIGWVDASSIAKI